MNAFTFQHCLAGKIREKDDPRNAKWATDAFKLVTVNDQEPRLSPSYVGSQNVPKFEDWGKLN
jgi:hypothetical protein